MPDDLNVLVVEFGVEGGGETIYGDLCDGEWQYRSVGSAGGMLDEEEDPVHSWTKGPVSDLDTLLPAWFYMVYPLQLNPAFAKQVMELWRGSLADHEAQSGEVGHFHRERERDWERAVAAWRTRNAGAQSQKK